MTEHVHKWRLQVEGPDCDECQYSAIVGIAACACGELLAPTAIERRLNATETLSAAQAENIGKRGPRGKGEIPPLLKYAVALDVEKI